MREMEKRRNGKLKGKDEKTRQEDLGESKKENKKK